MLVVRKLLKDYTDVFSEKEASSLPDDGMVSHAINIQPGKEVPYHPIYHLSNLELQMLCKYLDDMLACGWIRLLRSLVGAPILFVPKKDGSLWLCVDYWGLNQVTIKD